jgi:hypothetical protein
MSISKHFKPKCFILPGIATGPPNNWQSLNLSNLSQYIGIGIYNSYYAYTLDYIRSCTDYSQLNPNIEFTPELREQLLSLLNTNNYHKNIKYYKY